MLAILAVGGVLILLVVLLPVFKGIGSYKKVALKGYEPRVKVVKKKKKTDEDDDGQQYNQSYGYSTVFKPNSAPAVQSRRHPPQQFVNPYQARNSHIDNNFDYDQFIREQEQQDVNDRYKDYKQANV